MNRTSTNRLLAALLLLTGLTASLSANVFGTMEGAIYAQGFSRQDLLYTQKDFIDVAGNQTVLTHVYYREDGSQAAYERVFLENGVIVNYQTEIFDLDMYGEKTRNGSSMTISQQQGGKSKEKIREWDENLVAGPMLPSLIGENRGIPAEGKKVEFLLPFFDIQTLIPFKLVSKNGLDDGGRLTVQMKLKNGLLGMLIKPIDFVVDMDTGLVLEIHGPTILPVPGSSSKNNLVKANIYYSYENIGGNS
jgi:hypothetical protein